MMNGVALILVVFSLAGAGVWSPEPPKPGVIAGEHRPPQGGGENTVREGHRLIILEYEREAPQRRPPPLDAPPGGGLSGAVEEAKEKLAEAVSVLPNLGQGISTPLAGEAAKGEAAMASGHGTKEMICDAYGVCKEKLAGIFGKSKEKAARVQEAVGGAAEKVKEAEEGFAGKVFETAEEAVEKVRQVGTKAEEKAKELRRNVTERAVEVKKNLTDIVHRAHEVVYDAAAYVCTAETAAVAAAVAHLLAFATAYGACVWVTFVSSHVLAGALSRHQFGILQSKLYPVYFRAMAYAVGGAALTAAGRSQRYLLLGSLVLVLVNMLFLEPKATKVMFEKMKMEKEEGRGRDMADLGMETTTSTTATATATPTTATFGVTRTTVTQEPLTDKEAAKNRILKLDRKLKALNTYSSFLNVLSLMGLTWHLVHLARGMQGSCEAVGAH
ncbi:unnamed protein product [Spirodela intermedia]|uniref:TMEM205-like domain-containing protein n=1 Tax=Spirodela intermedia TaxID=51605 RepID=A0A7I8KR97_SPIIN|nr:unnamed protein product [Spirodela intermedia]